MNKLLFVLICFTSLFISSCDKDIKENEDNNSTVSIIGTWTSTSIENGESETITTSFETNTFISEFVIYDANSGQTTNGTIEGTYELAGNSLISTFTQAGETQTRTVIYTLKNDILELIFTEEDGGTPETTLYSKHDVGSIIGTWTSTNILENATETETITFDSKNSFVLAIISYENGEPEFEVQNGTYLSNENTLTATYTTEGKTETSSSTYTINDNKLTLITNSSEEGGSSDESTFSRHVINSIVGVWEKNETDENMDSESLIITFSSNETLSYIEKGVDDDELSFTETGSGTYSLDGSEITITINGEDGSETESGTHTITNQELSITMPNEDNTGTKIDVFTRK